MRTALTIAGASLLTAVTLTPAAAADPISIPISTDAALPVAGETGFDWSGFYAGVHGGIQLSSDDGQGALGIHAGVNTQFDFYLLGAEVAVSGLPQANAAVETVEGQILGRAGLVVSDNALVYAAGGYGIDLGASGEQEVLAGGGVELGVSDSASVRAQYLHSFPVQGDTPEDQFTLGASIHF